MLENQKLGAYTLLEKTGKGGMASVYRARQTSIDRDVAIKVILKNIAGDVVAIQRFQREAKLIARLEHPHIVPIYDFDGAHDPPYIVMRYLEGGTLKDVMGQGRLPYDEVIHIALQISSALDYAHRQGIIHRDIKPSNILLDREGNAFVSDLGLGRLVDTPSGGRQITETGMVMGTPDYMSPEQAMGAEDIDHRADIYALGVMLFELLTGSLPFVSPSAIQKMMMHIQSPPPSILSLNASLPPETDAIFQKALAKEPELRYATAEELVRALSQFARSTSTILPVQLRAMAENHMLRATRESPLLNEEDSTNSYTTAGSTPEHQRYVTVAYINATELEALLLEHDPEEAADWLAEVMGRIQATVEQQGGFIRERTAASIQALWGVHEVHEDDPETAINTALAVRNIAQSLTARWRDADDPMPIQIGIDTGTVLIQLSGDQIMTSGQPITLAARIEQAAPEGAILISQDTFRHVIGIYDVIQDTPLRIRGRTEPLDVYLVSEARPRAFRLQTRGVEGIETRMIGRDSELKLLQDALQLCSEDSESQMVSVTADAGVGKSRLLFEFTRWIDIIDQVVMFFEGRATQQSNNLPYSLFKSIFVFRFEILDSDTPDVMRKKLTQGIIEFMGDDAEEKAALIGQLLGFDFSDHPTIKLLLHTPDALQQQAIAHLHQFFRCVAQINPTIIELEDVHWADPKSLDLIDALVTENRDLPLMVICMARPELKTLRPSWGEGQDFHHRIDLKPLSKLDTRRLVREVLQKVDDIPAEIRDLIVERADGNPFYIEELVKILIEDGVIIKGELVGDQWRVLPEKLADLRVPPTLTGILQARLDTLEPAARLLLSRASVLGRTFWVKALDALSAADGFQIKNTEQLLDDLRRRELIYQREKSDFAGTHEYIIKHSILRDVIYDSLLKRQQRAYHLATANWLIEISAERTDEYNGLIAQHYEKAGDMIAAVRYHLKAATITNRISPQEAGKLLKHALAILPEKGAHAQHPELELESNHLRLQISTLLLDIYLTAGQLSEMSGMLEPTLALARHLEDAVLTAKILVIWGRMVSLQESYVAADKYLLEAVQLAREGNDREVLLFTLRNVSHIYVDIPGKVHQAVEYLLEAIEIARASEDDYALASIWNILGNAYAALERYEESFACYKESMAISRRTNDLVTLSSAIANEGVTLMNKGDRAEALELLLEAFEIIKKIGTDTLVPLVNISQTKLLLGHPIHEIEAYLQPLLRLSLKNDSIAMLVCAIELYGLYYAREGEYLLALEYLGLALSSGLLELMEKPLFIDPMIDRMRDTLTEAEIQAALDKGASLDVQTVAKSLLKAP